MSFQVLCDVCDLPAGDRCISLACPDWLVPVVLCVACYEQKLEKHLLAITKPTKAPGLKVAEQIREHPQL